MNRQFGVLLTILCAVSVLLTGCGPKKVDVEDKKFPVYKGASVYGAVITEGEGESVAFKQIKLSSHPLNLGIAFKLNDLSNSTSNWYHVTCDLYSQLPPGLAPSFGDGKVVGDHEKACKYMQGNKYYDWSYIDGTYNNDVTSYGVTFLRGRFQADVHNYLLKAGVTDAVRAEIVKEFSQLVAREKVFKSKLEALKPKVGDIKVVDRSGLLSGEDRRSIQGLVHPMIKYDSIMEPSITVSSIVPEDVGGILHRIRNQIALSEVAMGLSLKTASCSEINEYDIGYKYVVKCRHSEDKKNLSGADKIRVKVVVAKKEYKDLLPESFTFTDGNISVKKNENSVEIVNSSNAFAEVKQFSLYIHRSGEDSSVPYQFNWSASRGAISPDTSEDISSNFWSLYKYVENRQKNFLLNKKEAESSGLTVGVAVRYQMDGKMHTLFRKRTWPLIRLL